MSPRCARRRSRANTGSATAGGQVDSYRYEGERLVVAVVEGEGEAAARREVEADLLVAADGRFSHVRAQVEGGQLPPPRVMDVANFKFLCAAPEGLIDDYVRVYNTPAAAALQPHPRRGRGNVRIPTGGTLPECAQLPARPCRRSSRPPRARRPSTRWASSSWRRSYRRHGRRRCTGSASRRVPRGDGGRGRQGASSW